MTVLKRHKRNDTIEKAVNKSIIMMQCGQSNTMTKQRKRITL